MSIQSKPASPEYKKNWELIFGEQQVAANDSVTLTIQYSDSKPAHVIKCASIKEALDYVHLEGDHVLSYTISK